VPTEEVIEMRGGQGSSNVATAESCLRHALGCYGS
jgi:hypothetical protein